MNNRTSKAARVLALILAGALVIGSIGVLVYAFITI